MHCGVEPPTTKCAFVFVGTALRGRGEPAHVVAWSDPFLENTRIGR
jgi:hypothetical protein